MYKWLCRIGFLFSVFLCLQVGEVTAQPQSPSEFLGYELGSRWTPHHKVMDYIRHIAEESPLVEARKYGESNEGRSLMLIYISAESNMDRLEQIQVNNLKRTSLIEGEPSAEKTAIVWLSYNVHGNEPSSSEAAMKTLYELVRPNNAKTKRWLENVVVIIDPMLNPDGRDRYVSWYKQTAGADPNVHPAAREHHEPWPGGRTNHYYFDLNRDWAWLIQKESRARLAEYQRWMPHIHVDFHEQYYKNPYYFAPGAEPYHNAITDWQRDFQHTIGENNAEYFDEHNWLYFTGEVFDLFYPSYGDTYPIFNGAIGMTYEQGGHSRAGLGILKVEGDTLRLNDRVMHHVTTGFSTVEVSSRKADKIVDEFEAYYDQAAQDPSGKYKTYVFKADNDPDKLQAFFSLLDRHRIEYGKARKSRTFSGYNYQKGRTERVEVNEGDYLVSAYQPKSVLARVLLEPRPELSDSLTYDITAWAQHYAFGLDGYALTQRLNAEPASFTKQSVDNAVVGRPYAYLAEWQSL
ncbi:MAG TPA: M14 metallopeptidase family protein, partial [Fodinibius sp.]|nr:M14 metallopeptidase family protein [Fodinibius sp.]